MHRFSVLSFIFMLLLCTGCVPPTFNPEAGNYTTPQQIQIVPDSTADKIYYTTNGSTPTTESNPYLNPITVNDDLTINAIAVRYGFFKSNVATAHYSINAPPVVNAGADISVHTGNIVLLSGSASDNDAGDTLSFSWTITSKPSLSDAAPSPDDALDTSFVADKTGDYIVELVVSDGSVAVTDTMVVSAENMAPIANAGTDKQVHSGNQVQIDASTSYDPDGDTLEYTWTFLSTPDGSTAFLQNVTIPIFTADKIGDYIAELTVSDGEFTNTDTMTITATNEPPIAVAGSDLINIPECTDIILDGSSSTDPDGDTITQHQWTVTTPNSETFMLFGSTPSFKPDTPGTYTAALVVNDGFEDSLPSTCQISVVQNLIIQNFENSMGDWVVEEIENAPNYGIDSYEIDTNSGNSFKIGKGTNHGSYGKLSLIKRFSSPTYVTTIRAKVLTRFGSTLGTGYLRIDGTQIGGNDDLDTQVDTMQQRTWTIDATVTEIAFRYHNISPFDQMYIDDIEIETDCDESLPTTTWYLDSDNDGYGDPDQTTDASMQPGGYVHDNTDCNDSDAGVHPGAYDVPENGIDEDCDGSDATNLITWYLDDDGDGYGDPGISTQAMDQPAGYAINNQDCDDTDPAINPDASEIKDNDTDEDCDGVKEYTPFWYLDSDGDGYGDPDVSIQADNAPSNHIADNTDCDDSTSTINPGEPEDPYNGIDDNCDGQIDENFVPRNIEMVEDWVALELSIRQQMMDQHNGGGEPGGAIDWTSSAPNGGSSGTCRWHVYVSGFVGDSTFYYYDWNETIGGTNMAVSGSVHGVFGLAKSSLTDGTLTISDKWNGTIVDNIYIDGGVKDHGYYEVTCSDYGCADGPIRYEPASGGGWRLVE